MEKESDPLVLRLLKNLSTTNDKMSFSPVITVHEDNINFGEIQTSLKELEERRFLSDYFSFLHMFSRIFKKI